MYPLLMGDVRPPGAAEEIGEAQGPGVESCWDQSLLFLVPGFRGHRGRRLETLDPYSSRTYTDWRGVAFWKKGLLAHHQESASIAAAETEPADDGEISVAMVQA